MEKETKQIQLLLCIVGVALFVQVLLSQVFNKKIEMKDKTIEIKILDIAKLMTQAYCDGAESMVKGKINCQGVHKVYEEFKPQMTKEYLNKIIDNVRNEWLQAIEEKCEDEESDLDCCDECGCYHFHSDNCSQKWQFPKWNIPLKSNFC